MADPACGLRREGDSAAMTGLDHRADADIAR
jgi:hypothetical protein